jgi:sarcosine oxidase subunit alpha
VKASDPGNAGAENDRRLPTVERGRSIQFSLDGVLLPAYEGETIAAALFANGIATLRRSPVRGMPRGYYCGMGICFDCVVVVDGTANVRACVTPVREGMIVDRGGEHP